MDNGEINEAETAIVPIQAPVEALGVFREPDIVLEEARKAAAALMDVIKSKKKQVNFQGETYLEYEDWMTLARFYSMTVAVKSTEPVVYDTGEEQIRGWEAKAEVLLVPTNQVISSAEAMCLNDERNWSNKPYFQLRSMAQTRACSKALRNVLAWVVVLAGYKPTPGEEIDSMERVPEPRQESEQPQSMNGGPSVDFSGINTIKELEKEYFPLLEDAKKKRDGKLCNALLAAKNKRKAELEAQGVTKNASAGNWN